MAYETILYEVSENILTITLNRPDKLNAFTLVMMRELIEAFEVARTTARRAIAVLREEGLIYTVPQRGSYVARRSSASAR